MKKKMLSIILTTGLLLSLIPLPAYANECTSTGIDTHAENAEGAGAFFNGNDDGEYSLDADGAYAIDADDAYAIDSDDAYAIDADDAYIIDADDTYSIDADDANIIDEDSEYVISEGNDYEIETDSETELETEDAHASTPATADEPSDSQTTVGDEEVELAEVIDEATNIATLQKTLDSITDADGYILQDMEGDGDVELVVYREVASGRFLLKEIEVYGVRNLAGGYLTKKFDFGLDSNYVKKYSYDALNYYIPKTGCGMYCMSSFSAGTGDTSYSGILGGQGLSLSVTLDKTFTYTQQTEQDAYLDLLIPVTWNPMTLPLKDALSSGGSTGGAPTPASNAFPLDVWSFLHSMSDPDMYAECMGKGYYISREDYERLTSHLSATNIDRITNEGTMSRFNIDEDGDGLGDGSNYIDFNGFCAGLTFIVSMVNEGVLNASDIDPAINTLQAASVGQAKSAASFYWAQQFLTSYEKLLKENLDGTDFVSPIENSIKAGHYPTLVLHYYELVKKDWILFQKEELGEIVGHAVVAYGIEDGKWSTQDIEDLFTTNNKASNDCIECYKKHLEKLNLTYTKRIKIYDENFHNENYTSVYVSEDGSYLTMPSHQFTCEIGNMDPSTTNNGYITDLVDGTEANLVDYRTGNILHDMDMPSDNIIVKILGESISLSVENAYGEAIKIKNSEAKSNSIPGANFASTTPVNDGEFGSGETENYLLLPAGEDYKITCSNVNDIQISTENSLTTVSTASAPVITCSRDGQVSVEQSKGGNVYLRMTQDTPAWDTAFPSTTVSVSDSTGISVRPTSEGLVVTGDGMEDACVSTTDFKDQINLNVSTDRKTILITEENDLVKAVIDTDENGDFDTTIAEKAVPGTEKAENTISAKNIKLTRSADTQKCKIGASAKYKAPLTYASSSSKIKVSSKGTITVAKRFTGRAYITITAAETAASKEAVKKIALTVLPKKTKITSLSSPSGGCMKLTWKKGVANTGYQIQYSTSSSFKKGSRTKTKTISKSGTTSCSLKKLAHGKKYYVRIRTFKTVNGKKYYSGWSQKLVQRV